MGALSSPLLNEQMRLLQQRQLAQQILPPSQRIQTRYNRDSLLSFTSTGSPLSAATADTTRNTVQNVQDTIAPRSIPMNTNNLGLSVMPRSLSVPVIAEGPSGSLLEHTVRSWEGIGGGRSCRRSTPPSNLYTGDTTTDVARTVNYVQTSEVTMRGNLETHSGTFSMTNLAFQDKDEEDIVSQAKKESPAAVGSGEKKVASKDKSKYDLNRHSQASSSAEDKEAETRPEASDGEEQDSSDDDASTSANMDDDEFFETHPRLPPRGTAMDESGAKIKGRREPFPFKLYMQVKVSPIAFALPR
jgi:hypothetical protein